MPPSKIKLQAQSACFTDILKEIKLKFQIFKALLQSQVKNIHNIMTTTIVLKIIIVQSKFSCLLSEWLIFFINLYKWCSIFVMKNPIKDVMNKSL